ncbi:oxidoreductase [Rhexocercosporidium sp. MPI-PUGE-AT-0058]|nr:oxidoreductase [Rhexocercosporidium sp. MPI-PUGE-AT-0058]
MSPSTEPSREDLTSRILPQMEFGKGTGLTSPPADLSSSIPSNERAQQRFEVKGNAIITGGAGTLGLAAARALLEHGLTNLALFDINPSHSASQIHSLQTSFPTAKILLKTVDITDDIAVEQAVEETSSALGPITHLLCFAGVVNCVHAIDMTASQWRRTLDINTTGSFLCAQAVARLMIAQRTGGSIVFVASISGHRVNFPQPQVAYNVSKAALLTMKNCLAAEWARYGIRVNSISPGYMDTILNEGDGIAEGRAIWADRNPTGRMGTPSELTGAVVLLASSASTYMNGTDIVVDGGQTVL